MRTPYVSYVLLSKIILLSFCSFYLKLESLYVSYVKHILMAIVVIAPDTLLPEALHDVGLVLIVLRIAVLRCRLARQFSIDGIATPLEHESTTFDGISTPSKSNARAST